MSNDLQQVTDQLQSMGNTVFESGGKDIDHVASHETGKRADRAKVDEHSDAGQLAAIETAATTGLDAFRTKRTELVESVRFSEQR